MIKRQENVSHKERLRELGLQTREDSRRGLKSVYKYLMREGKEDKSRLFSVVSSEGTRGNRYQLKHRNSVKTLKNKK